MPILRGERRTRDSAPAWGVQKPREVRWPERQRVEAGREGRAHGTGNSEKQLPARAPGRLPEGGRASGPGGQKDVQKLLPSGPERRWESPACSRQRPGHSLPPKTASQVNPLICAMLSSHQPTQPSPWKDPAPLFTHQAAVRPSPVRHGPSSRHATQTPTRPVINDAFTTCAHHGPDLARQPKFPPFAPSGTNTSIRSGEEQGPTPGSRGTQHTGLSPSAHAPEPVPPASPCAAWSWSRPQTHPRLPTV